MGNQSPEMRHRPDVLDRSSVMSTGTTTPTPTRINQETHVAMLPNETYQASTATTTNGRVILVSVETISTDQLSWA